MVLEEENRHVSEGDKNVRKQDRIIKEMLFQAEEDHKNSTRMQDMIDKLQGKIKTYKRQVDEAVSEHFWVSFPNYVIWLSYRCVNSWRQYPSKAELLLFIILKCWT